MRKSSQQLVGSRRENSTKRQQARSLSNAPLAKAESLEFENKKLIDSQISGNPTDSVKQELSSKIFKDKQPKQSDEETSSSVNDFVKDNNNNSSANIPQQQSIFKKANKKTTHKIKTKTSKLLKGSSDIPVQMSYESEDLLDDSKNNENNKSKKVKRKKSLIKTKSANSTIEPTKTNNSNKNLNNKSSDDLISSSCENALSFNSKAEESEDGLATVFTNNSSTKNSKSIVNKIGKTLFPKKNTTQSTTNSNINLPNLVLSGNNISNNNNSSTNNSNNYNSIQSPIISSGNQLLSPILSSFNTSTIFEQDTTDYLSLSHRGVNNTVLPSSLHSNTANNFNLSFNNSNSASQSLSSSKRSNLSNSLGSSNPASNSNNDSICLENDNLSNISSIPYIVEKCISYIEKFGIDSEGVYRMSGNKQYTDSLFDDMINRQDSIDLESYNTSQINANIVATVIKDYFRHLKEPIIGSNLKEFIDLSKSHFIQNPNILSQIAQNNRNSNQIGSNATTNSNSTRQATPPSAQIKKQLISSPIISSPSDPQAACNVEKSQILSDISKLELIESIKTKFRRLNRVNYLTLKKLFLHLNLVAANSAKNKMDSNNLAICWMPTLLRPKFEDLGESEMLKKTLQPLIKFIIDNVKLIFEVEEQSA